MAKKPVDWRKQAQKFARKASQALSRGDHKSYLEFRRAEMECASQYIAAKRGADKR